MLQRIEVGSVVRYQVVLVKCLQKRRGDDRRGHSATQLLFSTCRHLPLTCLLQHGLCCGHHHLPSGWESKLAPRARYGAGLGDHSSCQVSLSGPASATAGDGLRAFSRDTESPGGWRAVGTPLSHKAMLGLHEGWRLTAALSSNLVQNAHGTAPCQTRCQTAAFPLWKSRCAFT